AEGGYAALTAGRLWVTNPAGLYEIDPSTNTARLHRLHIEPFDALWIADAARDRVARQDSAPRGDPPDPDRRAFVTVSPIWLTRLPSSPRATAADESRLS